MATKVKIERGEDGTYGAYIEENKLPYGLIGEGNTAIEAKNDFLESYGEMKAYYEKTGKEFVESEFEFAYDIPSFLSYYSKMLTLAGLERITGVNQGQLSHYVTGHRKPSRRTVKKIEQGLKDFADDLKQVEFV